MYNSLLHGDIFTLFSEIKLDDLRHGTHNTKTDKKNWTITQNYFNA